MVKMKKIEKPDRHKSKKRSGRRPNSKVIVTASLCLFTFHKEFISDSEVQLFGRVVLRIGVGLKRRFEADQRLCEESGRND